MQTACPISLLIGHAVYMREQREFRNEVPESAYRALGMRNRTWKKDTFGVWSTCRANARDKQREFRNEVPESAYRALGMRNRTWKKDTFRVWR